jgi:HlyD family secretion protein
VSTPAPEGGERVARALGAARARFTLVARSAAREARPWLRPENWTRANLRALVAAARERPRRAAAAGAAVVLVVLAAAWLLRDPIPPGVAMFVVEEAPFDISVVESGTLQALRSVTYASTIQSNQAKIIAMVPEGKLVQKGDMLLLFDGAPFEEEIRRSQGQLSLAEADVQKAQQDLKLQSIQNQEELAAAKQKVERSRLELADVSEGKGRLREAEATAAVGNAERDLEKAVGAHEDLKPLLAEGFITKQELDRAAQAVSRAREELELAKRRHDALVRFGRPLEMSQAEAEASMTRESARQLEAAAAYRMEQKRSAIAAAESRITEAAAKLALAKQQLARTEVRADVPGIVVYKDVFFGSEQRKPQVGDQVWANQPLLILPDISKMVVETRVRETDIHKVEKNQNVTVRVQAYPDLKLTGKVTLVGTLAQEEKERRGVKFFGVTIQIEESEPRLRPGMTAAIEIQVERRANTLRVPLEAVFERDGRHLCYVATRRGLVPREVVLGPSNRDFVVVEKGLRRGDRVALRDPSAAPSDFGSLTSS